VVIENNQYRLHPDYRGSTKIRIHFYGSNRPYSDDAQKQRDKIVESLTDPKDPTRWLEYQQSKGKMVSVPKTDVTIAHDPQVLTHWNSLGGKDTNQTTRREWFTFVGRLKELKVQSGDENSANQKRNVEYDTDVGPNFTGPGDKKKEGE
jgi:hypothetical protein